MNVALERIIKNIKEKYKRKNDGILRFEEFISLKLIISTILLNKKPCQGIP